MLVVAVIITVIWLQSSELGLLLPASAVDFEKSKKKRALPGLSDLPCFRDAYFGISPFSK